MTVREERYRQACVDYVEASIKEAAENETAKAESPHATQWFADRIGAWNHAMKARADRTAPVVATGRPCPACEARGQTWPGDKPVCAFLTGRFSDDNWQCATMNVLREKMEMEQQYTLVHWNDDQNCGVLGKEGRFLILGWYKSRGRTEACSLMADAAVDANPTLEDVQAFL